MPTSYHESDDRQAYWDKYEEAYREESEGFPVLYDPARKVFFSGRRSRRDDRVYRRMLTNRYTSQIAEEKIHTYMLVNRSGWKSYRNSLKTPYKKFPRPGGVVIVVVEGGDKELPRDEDELLELVDHWIETAPPGMPIHGSRGFGGKHAGSKPSPKGNIKIYSKMSAVKAALRRDQVPYSETDEEVRINMNEERALDYVRKNFT